MVTNTLVNQNADIGSLGATGAKNLDMLQSSVKTKSPAVIAIAVILVLAAVPYHQSVQIVGGHIQPPIGNVPPFSKSCIDYRLDQSSLVYDTYSHTMQLLQLNCQSYNTTKQQVHNYVQNKNIQVICLSETWNKVDSFPFKNWNTHFKNRANDPHGGVAIAVDPSIKMVRDESLQNSTEVAWVKLFLNNRVVYLASVYIPPGKVDHIDILSNTLDSLPADTPLILTGDFNATSPAWDNRSYIPRNTPSFRVGRRLEELIAQHGLEIQNTGHYTYTKVNTISNQVTKTAIDITLTRNIGSCVQWSVDELAPIRSDHLVCVANIQPVNPSPPIIRWDLNGIDWSTWESNLDEALQRWYDHIVNTTDDVNLLCESFTEAVKKCANDHIPTKTVSRYSRPFFNAELKALQDELRDARRSFRYRSDQRNLHRLNQAKDKYHHAYNRASTTWWSKTLEKIDHKNLWKVVNKIKNSHTHVAVQPMRTTDGEYLFQDKDIATQLEEVHIHRRHAVSSSFDEDWKNLVEEEVNATIQRESIRIHQDLSGSSTQISKLTNITLRTPRMLVQFMHSFIWSTASERASTVVKQQQQSL